MDLKRLWSRIRFKVQVSKKRDKFTKISAKNTACSLLLIADFVDHNRNMLLFFEEILLFEIQWEMAGKFVLAEFA